MFGLALVTVWHRVVGLDLKEMVLSCCGIVLYFEVIVVVLLRERRQLLFVRRRVRIFRRRVSRQ
jgi:hypothetical protein